MNWLLSAKRPSVDDFLEAFREAGGEYVLPTHLPPAYQKLITADLKKLINRAIIVAAHNLAGLSNEAREKELRGFIEYLEDEEMMIPRESCYIPPNEAGEVLHAVRENKNLIFRLSEKINPILKKTKKILLKKGFTRGVRFKTPKKLFFCTFS